MPRLTPKPWMVLGLLVAQTAAAQTVPRRQIPASVLTELSLLEQRFESALAADCHVERCFSKGCAYVDHAVIDRPRSSSLPGLGDGPGPGAVEPQEFLTQATCAFAYEPSIAAADAEALGRRLQSKMSHGFTSVSVSRQELSPLPEGIDLAPVPPAPEEPELLAPELPSPEWSTAVAARELWTHLLPNVWWMIGVVMLTVASVVLFWAWRRVGRETIEEKAMLAALLRDEPEPEAATPAPVEAAADDEAFVAAELEAWRARLAAPEPDPQLAALVRELLRDRDLPTLAKATLLFPDSFLAAFPSGGDVAAAKLELADFLKTAEPEALPSDAAFLRSLSRLARSAAISAQGDAQLVRSLREEFGGAGLVALIGQLPARPGALLFALSPAEERLEMVRLLSARSIAALAQQLLRSNRMDDDEARFLFDLLTAARAGDPLPRPPAGDTSDRGTPFDAAGPLSVLLAKLPPRDRASLFQEAVGRFQGALPSWYRGILFPDMLLAVPAAARADVFLSVDADALGAWLSVLDEEPRAALTQALPRALRASLDGVSFPSRARQLALAEQGRAQIGRALQGQLAQQGTPFEQVVVAGPALAEDEA